MTRLHPIELALAVACIIAGVAAIIVNAIGLTAWLMS